MSPVEFIALGLLVAVVLLIVWIAVRRIALLRSGGVEVCWRSQTGATGSGWALGLGRFSGDELSLFRSISLLPGASLVLDRHTMTLADRRAPVGAESDLLPTGAVIVRCWTSPVDQDRRPDGVPAGSNPGPTDDPPRGADLELALTEESLTGLRSWLEAAPSSQRRP